MAGRILRMNELDTSLVQLETTVADNTGYDVVYESDIANGGKPLAAIGDDEDLCIVGHGNPTSLGGRDPRSMAKLLSDGGLGGRVNISLYACNSGTGGAPYALELKVELVQKYKIMCTVGGTRGYLGSNMLGDLRVMDSANRDVAKPFFETTKAF